MKRHADISLNDELQAIDRFQAGNRNALAPVITHYDGWLRKKAFDFGRRNQTLDFDDIYSACLVGFMEAINAFDTSRQLRITTLAQQYILNSLQSLSMKSGHVPLPSGLAVRRIWSRAHATCNALGFDISSLSEQQLATLARRLDVKADQLSDTLAILTNAYADSLSSDDSEDESAYQPSVDPEQEENVEARQRSHILTRALSSLSPLDREIVNARFLTDTPETLESLGARHGIARESMRKREPGALERLRQAMLYGPTSAPDAPQTHIGTAAVQLSLFQDLIACQEAKSHRPRARRQKQTSGAVQLHLFPELGEAA